MLHIITDTHIGHTNMVRLCGRPEDFSELILAEWEKRVKPEDTVIHLGDIAWGDENLARILQMPGKKILVRGNHDPHSLTEYMDMGFVLACNEFAMNLDGMKVLFTHRPRFGHTADVNIHGHQHDLHREDMTRLYLPLALEQMGYRPIALNHEFWGRLHSWVARRHIPSVQEIMALRQDHLKQPTERDLYGPFTPEEHAKCVERRQRIELILNTPEFYRCKEHHGCWRLNDKFACGKMDETAYREALAHMLAESEGRDSVRKSRT